MSDAPVRVRFAPSPTGSLHVGGARTALFNWLYARKHGGVFILRIEDTDVVRSTSASEEALIESLRWLGLDWDEGPDKSGDFGPYRQSERLEIYRRQAAGLVATNAAYPCFCGDDELAASRERARSEGRDPHYDGSCAGLDPMQAAERAKTEPYTIRFRMPRRDVVIEDLVRGEVRFPAGMVGDFILLRQDGMPVYNFACVVDDGLMRISHVLRGEDHLPNTLRQQVLYEALGLAAPAFGHLSMILGEDRSKLSKRHGAVSVEAFRERGTPPEALVNYLALLGWNPGDDREDMPAAELVEEFSLKRIHGAAAIFDTVKMDWLAGRKIRAMEPEKLIAAARPFLGGESDERIAAIMAVMKERISCFSDLPRELAVLRDERPAPDDEARAWLEGAQPLLEALAGEIPPDLDAAGFKAAIKAAGKITGRKGKELFMPVRVALTGQSQGPDLGALAELLGRDEVLRRLSARES